MLHQKMLYQHHAMASKNYEWHGRFTFLKSTQPIEKTWRPSAYSAGVPLSDGGKDQPAIALIGQLF